MTTPTLDDLLKIYFNASNKACVTTDLRTPNFAEVTMLAGIAAVIKAMEPVIAEAFLHGVVSEHNRQSGSSYEIANNYAATITAKMLK